MYSDINNFEVWLKEDRKLSERTVKVYLNALNKLSAWFEETEGSPFVPSEVTSEHIGRFKNYIEKTEALGPATINKVLMGLKAFYSFEVQSGVIKDNPMAAVEVKRIANQYAAPDWLADEEVNTLFQSINKSKDNMKKAKDMAICRLILAAGLKTGEVTDLNIGYINLEEENESVTVGSRTIPLKGDVIDSLKKWLEYRAEAGSDEPLFVSQDSKRMPERTIHHTVVRLAQDAELNGVSPKTLRHTFAKRLVEQGVKSERLAYLLGTESHEIIKRYL